MSDVTMSQPRAAPAAYDDPAFSYIQWGPVIAGAIAAAALAFVLHTFAAAIGLAAGSSAPTWRDASIALWLLSGLYLILVALAAYGVGGYVAGRLRSPLVGASADETDVRDGTHGLLTWALATLLSALLIGMTATAVSRLAAPSAGTAGPAASVAGESVIAYDLDRLFRSERRPADVDMNYTRSEAARILLMSSSRVGVPADDRTYLARLVATRTGVALPDAERRTDTAIANARDSINKARRSGVILAFMIGAAALVGAAIAWFAAGVGGRDRDARAALFSTWVGWGVRRPANDILP